ncbi:MAG: NADH-quinone oxidoreductase subunit NuoE [Pseudomonadota bacterium]
MVRGNEIQKTVKELKDKYGSSKDALLPVLQGVQTKFRYIPGSAIKVISKELSIYEAEIYGVITFYAQFRLNPVGDSIIKVCKGTACHVGGAETVAEAVCDILGVKVNETTKDNKFTVEYVACLGCCSLAPVMMINDDVFGYLTKDKIKEVLKSYA